jgi:transposase
MMAQPPIPQTLWETLSPEAQAAVAGLVQAFEKRIADLEERLSKNSTNSSKPPSSDPPSVKRRPPASPSGKKRGGQPGHHRQARPLGRRSRPNVGLYDLSRLSMGNQAA